MRGSIESMGSRGLEAALSEPRELSAVGSAGSSASARVLGELCPGPTPPLRRLPALGRQGFESRSAIGRQQRGARPGRGRRGAQIPAGEQRRGIGRARTGGRQGGREGGGAELWPSCGARGARSPPGPVGLGSAAAAEPGRACGSSLSRRFYSELLHHGRCFHRFSGEMLALSVNKRSRFWQYLKTQCSRVLKLLGR